MKRFATVAALFVLLVVAGLSVAGLLYSPQLTIPPTRAGEYVEVSDVRLRVLQEGTGRDLLLIHGSPGMLEDFDEQALRLRDSFRITRYDRPGQGYSGDGGSYSFRYNAEIALALIEKLGLENTIVAGHSYGGSTALALAQVKSPRVAAVVVLDSAVYAPIRPVKGIYHVLKLPLLGLGLASALPASAIRETARKQIVEEFRAGPPPESFLFPERFDVLADAKVLHATANEHTGSRAELAVQSAGYAKIEIPVSIVSQRDDPQRKATAERLHAEVPRGELLLVSPSGHFVQIEQAQAVSDQIRRSAQPSGGQVLR